MPQKSRTRKVNRSSITGRFVRSSTVKTHRKTTTTDTVPVGRRRKKTK